MVKVTVKWGKETYKDVELDTAGSVHEFKAILYSMTDVPVEKQKVLCKGSVWKEDTDLSKIKDGAVVMLMGSAEERKINEPSKKTVFLEDLTAEERAKILKEKTGEILPCGLVNMGNTCYMNASLQCLRRINEFKDVVKKYSGGGSPGAQLAKALSKTFHQLDTKGEGVTPMEFFNQLTALYPHFGEMVGQGVYKQQDADECFQGILQELMPYLQYEDPEGDKQNLIDFLFNVEIQSTFKCIENEKEEPTVKIETSRKVPCIIDNQANPINNLSEGIEAGLSEIVEKTSDTLGRISQYQKIMKFSKLPPILVVQKIRFLWKKAVANTGSKATKAKILRNVAFPKILDMYNFATDELKKKYDVGKERQKKLAIEASKISEDKFEAYKKKLEEEGKMVNEDNKVLFKQWKAQQKDDEDKAHDDNLYRTIGTGLETGEYELIAVLTHQGRTSDSGHYVGWVHKAGDEWLKYDDDKVSLVKTEDIMALRGGGDWHMAYYCIYRRVEVD